ncbi:hypothetical protein ACLKA6_011059 [Drosophila palustris]
MDEVCRFCTLNCTTLENIFANRERTDNEPLLTVMLDYCTNCVIRESDSLPQNICGPCISAAKSAYEFKVRCEQSEKYFKDLLSECEQKPDIEVIIMDNLSTTENTLDEVGMEAEPYDTEYAYNFEGCLTTKETKKDCFMDSDGIAAADESNKDYSDDGSSESGESNERGDEDEMTNNSNFYKSKNYDMDEVCRFCTLNCTTLENIFAERERTDNEPLLITILEWCTNCEINECDSLPQNICGPCISAAKNAFEFKLRCEKSEKYFKNLLSECEQKPDIDEPAIGEPFLTENTLSEVCIKPEPEDTVDDNNCRGCSTTNVSTEDCFKESEGVLATDESNETGDEDYFKDGSLESGELNEIEDEDKMTNKPNSHEQPYKSKNYDMDEVCRFCTLNCTTLENIFAERERTDNEPLLITILEWCTNCEISACDSLPQNICGPCISAAKNAFEFKRRCEQSEKYFKDLLRECEQKPDIDELTIGKPFLTENTLNEICIKPEPDDTVDEDNYKGCSTTNISTEDCFMDSEGVPATDESNETGDEDYFKNGSSESEELNETEDEDDERPYKSKNYDMDEVCRFCTLNCNTLENIFAERERTDNEPLLITILEWCTNCEINECDSLPQNICGPCISAANAFEFKLRCEKSEKYFKNLLSECEQKPDIDEPAIGEPFLTENTLSEVCIKPEPEDTVDDNNCRGCSTTNVSTEDCFKESEGVFATDESNETGDEDYFKDGSLESGELNEIEDEDEMTNKPNSHEQPYKSKNYDMDEVCRFCTLNCTTLENIFAERERTDNEPLLITILEWCTNCEISACDSLPQNICGPCISAAKNAFEFKRRCEQSEKYFKDLLRECEQKPDIDELTIGKPFLTENTLNEICIKPEPDDTVDEDNYKGFSTTNISTEDCFMDSEGVPATDESNETGDEDYFKNGSSESEELNETEDEDDERPYKSKNYEMDEVCRFCTLNCTTLENIFAERERTDNKPLLITILGWCTNCKISESDSLPQNICGPCISAAKYAFEFKLRWEQSEKYFMERLSENEQLKIKYEIDEICRFCTLNCTTLENIFGERERTDNKPLLITKLEYFTYCEIKEFDSLPQNICGSCISAAKSAYEFKVRCEQSEKYFKELTGECEQKPDINELTIGESFLTENTLDEICIKSEPDDTVDEDNYKGCSTTNISTEDCFMDSKGVSATAKESLQQVNQTKLVMKTTLKMEAQNQEN